MFSFACLKLGANHVTGVEGRESLVRSALNNLTTLGYPTERFTFIQDDVFDYLKKVEVGEYDTILCLGIFYHTIRQTELLREIKRLKPAYLILDTFINKGVFINTSFIHPANLLKLMGKFRFKHLFDISKNLKKARRALSYEMTISANINMKKTCLIFIPEDCGSQWATIDPVGIVAWPTQALLEMMFRSHDFNLKQLKWDKREIKDWAFIQDYKDGWRASYIAQPLESHNMR